jgi:pilus assembly protein Flp/PilA
MRVSKSLISKEADFSREWSSSCYIQGAPAYRWVYQPYGENEHMNDLMIKLYVKMQTLMIREEGQDLVEYALVVALVAFGATAALKTLGSGLNTAFSNISSTLASSLA